MTQRNQLSRLLRSLDAGNSRRRENVALCDSIVLDQVECLAPEPNFAGRNSSSLTHRLCRHINHLRLAIGTDVSQAFHFCIVVILSEAKNLSSCFAALGENQRCFASLNMTRPSGSPADGDHFAVRSVIVSEIVLCGFALDDIKKELPQLRITRAGPQRFHNVELEVAAETWTQFPVACQAKFVAAFAEMQVCHRPDEADALFPTGNLVYAAGPFVRNSASGIKHP